MTRGGEGKTTSAAIVAVVTGCSGGIGFPCGELLAKRGYDLPLTARRSDPQEAATGQLGSRWKVAACSVESDVCRLYDGENSDAMVVHAGVATTARWWAGSPSTFSTGFLPPTCVRPTYSPQKRCTQ